ncbi:MAG TPA: pilus assembly protein, partial [Parvularculaceae bacterium]|nr:pilus assembly protein [Parvularculaceae bacterium]
MLIRNMKKAMAHAIAALKDKAGATAVEFSLVVTPFLMIMMSTFEVGWFYFANSQVDSAVT